MSTPASAPELTLLEVWLNRLTTPILNTGGSAALTKYKASLKVTLQNRYPFANLIIQDWNSDQGSARTSVLAQATGHGKDPTAATIEAEAETFAVEAAESLFASNE